MNNQNLMAEVKRCDECGKDYNSHQSPECPHKRFVDLIAEENGLLALIRDNVALFDCQGDCPDEVTLNEDLRTPEYCNGCFTRQILAKIREVVEGARLTDEEEFKIQAKSSSVFNELLVIHETAQAQLQAILKAIDKEKDEEKANPHS